MSNLPAVNVEPGELFRRLTQMPRPHKLFRFPRKDMATGEMLESDVAVVVLTEAELQSARASAELYAQHILAGNPLKLPPSPQMVASQPGQRGSIGYEEIYRNECVVEVVVRAVREPKNLAATVFPNAQLARQWLTSDEFAALFEAYCLWQAESGPLLADMDKDTMNAWIARLEEGGSAVPLALLSSEQRNRLLMHSVFELRKSRMANGSSGSPAHDGSLEAGASPTERVTPAEELVSADEAARPPTE